MALGAPVAGAAAPANDGFAGRISLSGPLPIAATGSNAEAGVETGEPPAHDFYQPAGHSVWFEWEAEATEWVTVATCDSDFDTMLDVYEGSSLVALELVARWKEGPRSDCGQGGEQVTFRALAGTSYAIRVDGDLSPQPPDATEGQIALQIASTPAPANDAFADAQTVTAESLEGGTFYRVDVPGFNWNATKEIGEPAHEGDPGGASVWYSWTAPTSGEAQVQAVAGALSPRLGAYTGSSVDALTPVGTTTYFPASLNVPVSAGTTYRFAVDGELDSASSLASMGQFTFLIYMTVPPPDVQTGIPYEVAPLLGDRRPPQTSIVKRNVNSGRRSVTLSFRSSAPAGKFLCRLDARREASCGSPKTYAGLPPGPHVFRVRAVDPMGDADSTPAVARFSISRPKQTHK
jgi:hypothetical protein